MLDRQDWMAEEESTKSDQRAHSPECAAYYYRIALDASVKCIYSPFVVQPLVSALLAAILDRSDEWDGAALQLEMLYLYVLEQRW